MVFREKFCVVYSEILTGNEPQCKWLFYDNHWEELLLLPVNAKWLRKTMTTQSLGQLTRLTRTKTFRNEPLVNVLLSRLLHSVVRQDNSLQSLLRQKHSLETLGVVLYCLFELPHVDFKQQILTLFCPLENADSFFRFMITQLVTVVSSPSAESLDSYVHLMALYVFLTLVSACDNLQRNSLLDHFSVNHLALTGMMDLISRGNHSLQQRELALTLLAILCNHRKHEVRNPFAIHLRNLPENEVHLRLFSLREVLQNCNQHLVKCTLGTLDAGSQGSISEFFESASENVISWGAAVGSAFGAWFSGVDDSATPPTPHRESSTGESRMASSPPLLAPEDVFCDATVWWHTRSLLLVVYELFCGSGGDHWIKVLVEHDVPPWAADTVGGVPQPLACSQLLLEVIKLVSFCLHSNSDAGLLAVRLGLMILRCLSENVQVDTLLFSTCLEECQNIKELHLFERRGASHAGALAHVSAMLHHNHSTKTERRERQPSYSGDLLEKSIAAVILRQLSCVLLEHCSMLKMHLESSEEPKEEPTRTKAKDGSLCIQVVECFHRLLLFEKRALSADQADLLGIEWGLISNSLFALLDILKVGPRALPDLSLQKYLWLCTHLAHIVSLVLTSTCLNDKERVLFLFQILTHRESVETLCGFLERDRTVSAAGGRRIVQHEMANLRAILFHFASVVMMIEEANPSDQDGERKKPDTARDQAIMAKMLDCASSLKLKPHNRLRDGFQKYAETAEERAVLRDFLSQLISDTKALRVVEREIRKKP